MQSYGYLDLFDHLRNLLEKSIVRVISIIYRAHERQRMNYTIKDLGFSRKWSHFSKKKSLRKI